MLGRLRQRTKPGLRNITKIITFLPLTANQFTFLAVPLSAIAAYFLARENYMYGALFVILAVLIDFLDGTFAEIKRQKSHFGNYFDAVIDRVVEAIIYLGLAFNHPIAGFICLATNMLTSYAKPRVALVIQTDNHDWPAIGERADRLLVLIIGIIITNFIHSVDIILITLILLSVINSIGFIQRVLYGKRLIEKATKERKILPYLLKKGR